MRESRHQVSEEVIEIVNEIGKERKKGMPKGVVPDAHHQLPLQHQYQLLTHLKGGTVPVTGMMAIENPRMAPQTTRPMARGTRAILPVPMALPGPPRVRDAREEGEKRPGLETTS